MIKKDKIIMQTVYGYIEFIESKPKPKTKVWKCINRRQKDQIGTVEWYGPWRRYAYVPTICAVYTEECLDDIKNFLAQADREHKNKKSVKNKTI